MARKSVVENNLEGSHMRGEDLGARSGSGGSPRDQPGGMDKAFLPRHPWAGVPVDIPVSRFIPGSRSCSRSEINSSPR